MPVRPLRLATRLASHRPRFDALAPGTCFRVSGPSRGPPAEQQRLGNWDGRQLTLLGVVVLLAGKESVG